MYWTPLAIVTIVIYSAALLFIFTYSMTQLNLVISYLKNRARTRSGESGADAISDELLPPVTIQLPVYNEMYVAERLLQSVSALDYPKAKLEIQVLDDSTDETVLILQKLTEQLRSQGFNITTVRRPDRTGFKAGALAYGLERCTGEFVAIFDADFLPQKDFLRRTIPALLRDEKIGVVQTRWGHVNEKFSLLTKLQAFGLNAHFTVEQKGRNASGYFINFNGTAGVWRKSCIIDSGGWAADTLTEDLDLSYRAQLRGWEFLFMEDVCTPAELPVTMSALKNQQYRWNKGAAECAKKNLPDVFRQHGLSLGKKIHAAFHLMNSTVFIAIMVAALLSIPMLLIKHHFGQLQIVFLFASFFLAGFLILGVFYFTAFAQVERRFPANIWLFLKFFPLFLSLSMGLALHNAIAVIEGYAGRKTPFMRTPKFNILSTGDKWSNNIYLKKGITWLTALEGALALYFGYGMLLGFRLGDFGLFPFHLMLFFGFAAVFIYSMSHALQMSRIRNGRDASGEMALSG